MNETELDAKLMACAKRVALAREANEKRQWRAAKRDLRDLCALLLNSRHSAFLEQVEQCEKARARWSAEVVKMLSDSLPVMLLLGLKLNDADFVSCEAFLKPIGEFISGGGLARYAEQLDLNALKTGFEVHRKNAASVSGMILIRDEVQRLKTGDTLAGLMDAAIKQAQAQTN